MTYKPPKYDVVRDYQITTPLMLIQPEKIQILAISSGVMARYQKMMSKAVWRPAPGRKLGFLVVHGYFLLCLIFLARPVIRLTVRDEFLFPKPAADFNYGLATKQYMDMSVCVGAQPIAWHWNLGKLIAMIAPTLGDYVETRYPLDVFKGVTTTSLYGRSTQYNRIYKFLGFTKGFVHEHIDDIEYEKMKDFLRASCPNCTPGCLLPLPLLKKHILLDGKKTDRLFPEDEWCTVPYARFGDGANARMRCIAMYRQVVGDKTSTFEHGHKRGVYYHPAISPNQRTAVIQAWYERWGLPRYERTKDQQSPYQNGTEGGQQYITT